MYGLLCQAYLVAVNKTICHFIVYNKNRRNHSKICYLGAHLCKIWPSVD